MSSKIIFERFLWFHNEIKEGKYPNTRTLAENFEITRKTAQRDIDFMRDRLGVPLIYVHEKRGFAYEDNTYEMPGFWLKEEALIALLIADSLVSTVPDVEVKTSLHSFLEQILANLSYPAAVSIRELGSKVSVRNIAYSKTSEKVYHQTLEAVLDSSPMRIEYYSPHTAKTTSRDILPLHLLNYMGTWHIIAHCTLKNDLRDFVLSRIKAITPCFSKINVLVSAGQLNDYIRRTFGIFHGKNTDEVCLRFSRKISPWITEQIWHPAQKISSEKDGSLQLTIPVADFREIKREILKYGAQVEVVSPAKLREEVKKEIEKMRNIYS